ncbi:acyltransferase domain-containing protein [Amycolatopsis japonica]|uniref:acyltransferase domain-containing protein n=1 Tax=Amycolatopsis japonica TaxID=208439 RepID=UPI003670C41F
MTQENLLTAISIEKWLTVRLATVVGIDPRSIDPEERFSRYELDSLRAVGLLGDLGAALGKPLRPTLLWENPTIKLLAEAASARARTKAPRTASVVAGPRLEDPIAVVGMACRFPGADDPDAYWRLLSAGVDAITEVPPQRWDADGLFDENPLAKGKVSSRWGGFLDRIDGFDARFFGISPREAAEMDPQQRLALELSWEALDDAGIAQDALRESRTGVFFGAMWNDYASASDGGLDRLTEHTATGRDLSIIPARVAYFLGLRGPAIAVNTACSSGLVAIHQARQSLVLGETSLAVVGAVNLLIAVENMVAMSRLGAMAPDGRCKAFDSRANGYVRGEGGGVVVLKPLSRALADGNPVYCVLRGSAINNDGFSNGLTAPNPAAQEEVLRDAYAVSGVDPAQVDYVETHGTGTMLGDPIEAGALGAVLGEGRPAERPLLLGSAKTNIGHLESAAGIAGFIKTALAVRNGSIPASLHFENPNPHIDFENWRLRVVSERTEWPQATRPALAGVSSFGFGGTNCHVVIEGTAGEGPQLVPVAASTAEGLRATAAELRKSCDIPGTSIADLRTAAGGRHDDGARRLALTVTDVPDLAARLDAYLIDRVRPGTAVGTARDTGRKPVFVFGGQGSQWLRMGRDLLTEPASRASLRRCDEAMRPYLGQSILDLLVGDDPAWLDDLRIVQPAIFAVQVALADLWRSWGVRPGAVVGQSMGEVAAACVAGCLSLQDAVRIICVRSAIVHRTVDGQGAMALVELPAEQTHRLLAGRTAEISVAVSSSPTATVISGGAEAVAELLAELKRGGITARAIQVDYASHSPQMDPLLPELRAALGGLRPHQGTVPFHSTVAGRQVAGTELKAGYWCDNLREPVLFAEVVRSLIDSGHDRFIDVDPHPLLVRNIGECLAEAGQEGMVLPSIRRGEPARPVLLDSLGSLYSRGQEVRWRRVHPPALTGTALEDQAQAPVIVPVSAHSPAALVQGISELAKTVNAAQDLDDVACTAARRSHHAYRIAVVSGSRDELANALALARERTPLPVRSKPRVVFVFSGYGASWSGMGRRLAETEPVFRDALEDCDAAIRRSGGFSVIEFLHRDRDRTETGLIEQIQPALFAMQVSLAALWRSWGVEPDAVTGQSMGEVAAAHVAGALSLEDAATLICRRSDLLATTQGRGAMALVELPLSQARELTERWDGRVEIAASNSPTATVLTGDAETLDEVLGELERGGIFGRRVDIEVAAHSRQVEPLLDTLRAGLRGIVPSEALVPFCSSVTGEWCAGPDLGPEYWARNLRQPVMAAPATVSLAEQGYQVFLEVSPHPVIGPAIGETLHSAGVPGAVIATAHKGKGDRADLLAAVAELYEAGCGIDWERLQPEGGRKVPLPVYPWQRERYWLDSEPEPGASTEIVDEGSVEDRLADGVARVLRLRREDVRRDVQLTTLGMTSLMAMELRNLVLRDLAVNLPVSLVLRAPGVSALAAEAQALMGSPRQASDAGEIVGSMERIEI